jgi:carboxymethylenebutenolidase
MNDIEITTSYVRVPSQDLRGIQAPAFDAGDSPSQIDAYLAQPTKKGKLAAVIVFHEIFGVNGNIREITELIARQGYIAIAPAMYQRIAPGFTRDFSPEHLAFSPEAYETGLQYYQQVNYWEIISDIQATIVYLKTLPNVKADAIAPAPRFAIGCIGFCFGGHVAYMAATLPDIKATASFYGGGITTSSYGEDIPTLDRTAQIKGTIKFIRAINTNYQK